MLSSLHGKPGTGIGEEAWKNENVRVLLADHERNIEQILGRLEDILKERTNVYENNRLKEIETKANFLASVRELGQYFEDNVILEPKKPKISPSKLPLRPSDFKPIKPDTTGKVKPAYLLQKATKSVSIQPKKSRQELIQSLSSESGTIVIQSVLPPAPEDLEETIDVVITQEMRDLVASFNNSPSRIYEWVKKNIEVEFYYGSLKGSVGTFIEKAGNDVDASSLLLALYRAANIPCRYVTGTIDIPLDKAQSITGVDNDIKIGSLLASAGSGLDKRPYWQRPALCLRRHCQRCPATSAANRCPSAARECSALLR